jgi:TolB-like protein/DNA-binding winged helix-turn-helix (wHTH) protein
VKQEQRSAAPQADAGTAPAAASYRLDDLLVLPGTQQLLRDGKEIPLPRLSFDLLLTLIRAAPNTVTLDELMERVWPGLVVSPETVTQRVKLLRDALGDDSRAARYIGLVRGRGYRLLVPALAGMGQDRAQADSKGGRGKALLLGALLLAVAALALYQGAHDRPPVTAPQLHEASLAVLPFATLSPAAQAQDYFAAGIHDDLLTRLAQVDALKVISRSSVLEYRDSRKNLRQIAHELGVANVLEGSVQQVDNRVRINVQLIEAASDTHLWAQTYDRELTVANLLDIQADIAGAIAHALQIKLLPALAIEPTATTDLDAYSAYLVGNGYRLRWLDEGDQALLPVAEDHYRRAIGLDPGFALAYAALARGLAEIYWQIPGRRNSALLEEARTAAERALQLVPDLAEAHLALGTYHYYGFRDYARALEEIALAERRMSGNADILATKSYILRRLGRLDDYVSALTRARQLAPRDPDYLGGLAWGLMLQQRYDESEELCGRLLELHPGSVSARFGLAQVKLRRDGEIGELRALITRYPERRPYLAWWFAWSDGDYTAARARLELQPGDDQDLGDSEWPRSLLQALTELYAGRPCCDGNPAGRPRTGESGALLQCAGTGPGRARRKGGGDRRW